MAAAWGWMARVRSLLLSCIDTLTALRMSGLSGGLQRDDASLRSSDTVSTGAQRLMMHDCISSVFAALPAGGGAQRHHYALNKEERKHSSGLKKRHTTCVLLSFRNDIQMQRNKKLEPVRSSGSRGSREGAGSACR